VFLAFVLELILTVMHKLLTLRAAMVNRLGSTISTDPIWSLPWDRNYLNSCTKNVNGFV